MKNMTSDLFLKILNRFQPERIWHNHGRVCKQFFNKPSFILSFDCDTEEDIAVAWEVHSKLMDCGILPVYAVPGKLLKKGEKTYSKILNTGSEFINHGGREHTYFDNAMNRHASSFFYDHQSLEDIKEDIELGHQILFEVLGVIAKGFRTPHFGTFQNPKQLEFLYSILYSLGYHFSTSTSPMMAYKKGPIYKKNHMIEIPVTGIYEEPFNIMDTWGFFAAPNRTKAPEDYLKTTSFLENLIDQYPLLINIYGDPSHIYDQPTFFQAMKKLSLCSENKSYTALLKEVSI